MQLIKLFGYINLAKLLRILSLRMSYDKLGLVLGTSTRQILILDDAGPASLEGLLLNWQNKNELMVGIKSALI